MSTPHQPPFHAAIQTPLTSAASMPPPLATAASPTSPPRSMEEQLSGNKRGLSRDGKQLTEKKLRRLEKNRLSARECRRRKREATENLQRQINLLEGENLRLRLQLQIGEEAEDSLTKEQEKVTEELDKLLKSGASEAEIFANIEEFKEKFADYGRDRRSAMEFHLRNVERLLMPTQTTSIAMTALEGGAASSGKASDDAADANPLFGGGEVDPKALFAHLAKTLGVTDEQAAMLKDSRFIARELDDKLKESLAVLGQLRTRLLDLGEELETEFNSVRAILTPTQSAKFLVWVSNNRACMHMLDELWSQVYSKQSSDELEEDGEEGEGSPEKKAKKAL